MLWKPSIASSTPSSVLVVYVLVSVRLYFSTTSTPTTRTRIITESYDGRVEDVDDEGDTRKLEGGEVSWFLEGGRGGRT